MNKKSRFLLLGLGLAFVFLFGLELSSAARGKRHSRSKEVEEYPNLMGIRFCELDDEGSGGMTSCLATEKRILDGILKAIEDDYLEGIKDFAQQAVDYGLAKQIFSLAKNKRSDRNPLEVCVRCGDVRFVYEILTICVAGGVSIHKCLAGTFGKTFLHLAVEYGQPQVAEAILQVDSSLELLAAIDCTPAEMVFNETALHQSVALHHPPGVKMGLVRAILAAPAVCPDLVNMGNNNGDTALHFAAYLGDEELVVMLLGHGASTTLKSNSGLTALAALQKITSDDTETIQRYGRIARMLQRAS
jgi:hypothetical protein